MKYSLLALLILMMAMSFGKSKIKINYIYKWKYPNWEPHKCTSQKKIVSVHSKYIRTTCPFYGATKTGRYGRLFKEVVMILYRNMNTFIM